MYVSLVVYEICEHKIILSCSYIFIAIFVCTHMQIDGNCLGFLLLIFVLPFGNQRQSKHL